MTYTVEWPQPWVRASLETAVLAVLAHTPAHGYAVATDLEDAGLGRPRGGSLYPLLARLEDSGAVTTSWLPGDGGPGRRLYAITDAGRARLTDELAAWRALTDTLTALAPADARPAPEAPTASPTHGGPR